MKRGEKESFKEYKNRRKIANTMKGHLLKGTTLHTNTFAKEGTLEYKRLAILSDKQQQREEKNTLD